MIELDAVSKRLLESSGFDSEDKLWLREVTLRFIQQNPQLGDDLWPLTDGYGTPGFMPVQGWDWSGFRDSSYDAIAQMAQRLDIERCPTIYAEVTTHSSTGVSTKTNVRCEGVLRPCAICGARTRCSREARCLHADRDGHWRVALFTLDDGTTYRGYTRGETWNGWQCPRFPKAEADRLMADLNAAAQTFPEQYFTITFDEVTQRYAVHDPQHADDPWVIEAELFDGEPCYGIGAGSWVWDQVK